MVIVLPARRCKARVNRVFGVLGSPLGVSGEVGGKEARIPRVVTSPSTGLRAIAVDCRLEPELLTSLKGLLCDELLLPRLCPESYISTGVDVVVAGVAGSGLVLNSKASARNLSRFFNGRTFFTLGRSVEHLLLPLCLFLTLARLETFPTFGRGVVIWPLFRLARRSLAGALNETWLEQATRGKGRVLGPLPAFVGTGGSDFRGGDGGLGWRSCAIELDSPAASGVLDGVAEDARGRLCACPCERAESRMRALEMASVRVRSSSAETLIRPACHASARTRLCSSVKDIPNVRCKMTIRQFSRVKWKQIDNFSGEGSEGGGEWALNESGMISR